MSRPDILLGLAPYKTAADVAEDRLKLETGKALLEERRANADKLRQEFQDRRTKYNESQALGRIAQERKSANQPITQEDFMSAAPVNGLAWYKDHTEARLKDADIQAKQLSAQQTSLENATKRIGLHTQLASQLMAFPAEQRNAKRQELLNSAYRGVFDQDELNEILSESMDDATLKGIYESSMSLKDRLDIQYKLGEQNIQAINADAARLRAETDRLKFEQEGKAGIDTLNWLKSDPQRYHDLSEKDKMIYGPALQQAGVRIPPKPSDDTGIELSGEALDMAALRYVQDGTLPAMGLGKNATKARQEIINRAARLFPNANVAANVGSYRADVGSLTNIQKSLDSITAYEQTAKKNLQQYVTQAQKVVDSGSPWVNRILRTVDRSGLGSTEQAAYDAARQVAFTEIARVVSNPNLTGVLSDAARTEMEKILSGDYTLAQTISAAKMLTTDMDNRKTSLEAQATAIRGRLNGGPMPGDKDDKSSLRGKYNY